MLLAAPEKAQTSLARKHRSELEQCSIVGLWRGPAARGAPARAGWDGDGAAPGCGIPASPSGLSPPRDPPGLATALAAGHRWFSPCQPFLLLLQGGKGNPDLPGPAGTALGPTGSRALWPPARSSIHTAV